MWSQSKSKESANKVKANKSKRENQHCMLCSEIQTDGTVEV